MLPAKASTKTGTPTRTERHVVHDYHLAPSNSDWENLKHPEAASDEQLACHAALTTNEGVPRWVTLYPASLGATMTRIHQVTSQGRDWGE